MRLRYVVPAALLALTLAACTSESDQPADSASPAPSPSPSVTTGSPSAEPEPSDSTGPSESGEASPGSGSGTAEDPTVVEPATDVLDWKSLPGPVADTVTRGGDWTLTVNESGTRGSLKGPQRTIALGTAKDTITDAFLDDQFALVVYRDKLEQKPSRGVVIDLGTGSRFAINGRSEVPTTLGGSWALGADTVAYATRKGTTYCLASMSLESGAAQRGWCAPQRHGFNGYRITPEGMSLMTFDDAKPACRTVGTVNGTSFEPFPDVAACKGWEGMLLKDGAVWSVIPQERRVEESHVYARSGDTYYDLGPGLSGSLTWCDDAAYFDRDPDETGDPAKLMRWDGESLSVVYESPGGEAFLATPRCGGGTMSVTALAEKGDEQVYADLG